MGNNPNLTKEAEIFIDQEVRAKIKNLIDQYTEDMEDKYKDLLKNFYEEYDPKYYQRTYNLRDNSGVRTKAEDYGTVISGKFRISGDVMNNYVASKKAGTFIPPDEIIDKYIYTDFGTFHGYLGGKSKRDVKEEMEALDKTEYKKFEAKVKRLFK